VNKDQYIQCWIFIAVLLALPQTKQTKAISLARRGIRLYLKKIGGYDYVIDLANKADVAWNAIDKDNKYVDLELTILNLYSYMEDTKFKPAIGKGKLFKAIASIQDDEVSLEVETTSYDISDQYLTNLGVTI